MLNKEEIHTRVRAQLFGHWSVLGPIILGGGVFSYGLIIANDWGTALFGAVAGVCGSAGSLAYRFFLKRDALYEQEIAKDKEKQEEAVNQKTIARERELNAFRRKLTSDGDTKDEHLFDDLRCIHDTFVNNKTWSADMSVETAANILARVDQAFETCLQLLDRSFTVRTTAQNLRGDGRRKLIETADKLLEEVKTTVDQLDTFYANVMDLSVRRLTGPTLEQSDTAENMNALGNLIHAADEAESVRRQLLSGPQSDDVKYTEYLHGAASSDKPS